MAIIGLHMRPIFYGEIINFVYLSYVSGVVVSVVICVLIADRITTLITSIGIDECVFKHS